MTVTRSHCLIAATAIAVPVMACGDSAMSDVEDQVDSSGGSRGRTRADRNQAPCPALGVDDAGDGGHEIQGYLPTRTGQDGEGRRPAKDTDAASQTGSSNEEDPNNANAGGSTADDPSAGPFDGCTLEVVLSTLPTRDPGPEHVWTFSTRDETLYVHVLLTGITNHAHELGFDFHVPDGYLYRRDSIQLKAGELFGGLPGYPGDYVDALALAEGWVVTYPLALAGSDIDTWDLHGRWRLAIRLDDDPTPLLHSHFTLTE